MDILIDKDNKEIIFFNPTLHELCTTLSEDFPEEEWGDFIIKIQYDD